MLCSLLLSSLNLIQIFFFIYAVTVTAPLACLDQLLLDLSEHLKRYPCVISDYITE